MLTAIVLLMSASCSSEAPPAITLSGLLNFNQPVAQTISGPEQEHHWVFSGQAANTISLNLSTTDILPEITLRDPNGQPLFSASNDLSKDTSLTTDITLTTNGPYTIVITLLTADATTYTLQIQNGRPTASITQPAAATPSPTSTAPPESLLSSTAIPNTAESPPLVGSGAILRSHQPIQGRLSQIGEVERYTFFGRANDIVTIGASPAPNSRVLPRLDIYSPSGEVITYSSGSAEQPDAISGQIALPSTGAYNVFIRDATGRGTGLYELAFGYGSTMRDTLHEAPAPDTVVTGYIQRNGFRDIWPVELTLGDIISVVAVVDDSSNLDPVLSLLSPDGGTIYTDDNSGGGRNAALREVIAPQTGRFMLAVSPANYQSAGTYTLLWQYSENPADQ